MDRIHPNYEPGYGKRTSQAIAKKVGRSHSTYERTKIIVKGSEQQGSR